MNRIRSFFSTTILGGFLVLLPIVIFVFIITFLFGLISDILQPVSDIIAKFTQYSQFIVNAMSLTAAILFCFVVGLIIRTRFGKNIFGAIENKWLSKLPLYKMIKETVKQFTGSNKMPFSEVVLVKTFGQAMMTGFITDRHENGVLTVFAPTGPNPTNGFILHVNEDQIVRLSITTEEAMKTIVGVGVGSSAIIAEALSQTSLTNKIENASLKE